MPVDGGSNAHPVMYVDAGNVTFLEIESRPRNATVYNHALGWLTGDIHFLLGNR